MKHIQHLFPTGTFTIPLGIQASTARTALTKQRITTAILTNPHLYWIFTTPTGTPDNPITPRDIDRFLDRLRTYDPHLIYNLAWERTKANRIHAHLLIGMHHLPPTTDPNRNLLTTPTIPNYPWASIQRMDQLRIRLIGNRELTSIKRIWNQSYNKPSYRGNISAQAVLYPDCPYFTILNWVQPLQRMDTITDNGERLGYYMAKNKAKGCTSSSSQNFGYTINIPTQFTTADLQAIINYQPHKGHYINSLMPLRHQLTQFGIRKTTLIPEVEFQQRHPDLHSWIREHDFHLNRQKRLLI